VIGGPALSAADNLDVLCDGSLVIEDDQAAGCFVYKTVDWRTGEVVQQISREQVLKMRKEPAYLKTKV
jgi:flagellar protein FlaG